MISADETSFAWRTKSTGDFVPENRVAFDWPKASEWQEVKVELPVGGSLIHLRIKPGTECIGLEIQSIELRGKDAEPRIWRFDSDKSSI